MRKELMIVLLMGVSGSGKSTVGIWNAASALLFEKSRRAVPGMSHWADCMQAARAHAMPKALSNAADAE
ncbi:MAG: hypothetical protein GTO67_10220 [Gammaproteobacteria bacterium]|nr:hypothetical protein [Gammaproteobacteria bacterium]NIN39004.1 hypothetical protein [Gammaproteobacteria bacterium]NIO25897.1 hypothetical protein [Gammaproteobacteria bacterium]NIP45588.1 hypothetical protein [Gammaproteobacteria bacterium]NIR22938.1 hypothetical protein [Gammaproteobacteria bacterium]